MSKSETFDRLVQNCDYRFRTVQCPRRQKLAAITAAKWQIADNRWTPWTVVDCPLLPAGEIWCDMTCLSQLETPSN